MSDAFPVSAPTPAPGAKAAKICGILAIVLSLTCVGIPVAIVLGIVALVQHGKAKRLAKAEPERYAAVTATGFVTGIIGLVLPVLLLPVVGIVSAIAIPAFLGQRERAREVVVQANLQAVRRRAEAEVEAIHAKSPGQIPSAEGVIRALAEDPAILALKNPYAPGLPALLRGAEGPKGTICVAPAMEEQGGVTTWSVRLKATAGPAGRERELVAEVVTHTQEKVHARTEDGWEVVNPPAEALTAPQPTSEPRLP